MSSKKAAKTLLDKYQLHPKKGLGQNFLVDKWALKKVIGTARLTKKDIVLEIGPGMGNLTQVIAKKAKKVIAVEKDLKLIPVLREFLKDFKNAEIVQGDVLKIPLNLKRYKVVANLPFYLTAPVIRKFLESELKPEEMVLIVQKEVAQRVCAKPPKMSILAVSVQFYAKPEIMNYIPRKSFWPEPKIDSAILKISGIRAWKSKTKRDLFFKVVKAGFSQPRKMLINNLAKKLGIEKEKIKEVFKENHISASQRPETLDIKDWENLSQKLSTFILL